MKQETGVNSRANKEGKRRRGGECERMRKASRRQGGEATNREFYPSI